MLPCPGEYSIDRRAQETQGYSTEGVRMSQEMSSDQCLSPTVAQFSIGPISSKLVPLTFHQFYGLLKSMFDYGLTESMNQ